MLIKLSVRNFKPFSDASIDLGERVVFVGPNNSGKTSALQALALWSIGARRWLEKRGTGNVPKERSGVTINRRDLIAVPIPTANLLWRDVHVREGYRDDGKQKTRNVLIEIEVTGIDKGEEWTASLEFDYANEESLYCRAQIDANGARRIIPAAAGEVRLAYLPPMSGLAANETRLDEGALDVRIGEGRTAEVLRNLCWKTSQNAPGNWQRIVDRMKGLFGVTIRDPIYVKERGEIVMSFVNPNGVELDLSASGRGQQQTLLLLAHMAANHNAVLLLDEPDAHLEILRQREIYGVLTEIAGETNSQIIAASHSEVLLAEAAARDLVISFTGRPHRVNDRGTQARKALLDIGFEHFLQAESKGWVLYLEGSTDLAILRAFADRTEHPARASLECPFVHYVGNRSAVARNHFHGLRDAYPDLIGLAIYDRPEQALAEDDFLPQRTWQRREIENYLCQEGTLLRFAEEKGQQQDGPVFAAEWRAKMGLSIQKIVGALDMLRDPSPWGPDLTVSDKFLPRVFEEFYDALGLPNLMSKTDFHTLAPFVSRDDLDPEIEEVLDQIHAISARANDRRADLP